MTRLNRMIQPSFSPNFTQSKEKFLSLLKVKEIHSQHGFEGSIEINLTLHLIVKV